MSGPSRRQILQTLASSGVVIGLVGCKGDESPHSAPPVDDSGVDSEGGSDSDSQAHSDSPIDTEPQVVDVSQFNVLHICADEINARFLGTLGHPDARTPNLDALRAQGVLCTRVYVSFPLCAPTRGSLLTGLFPQEHGQYANSYKLHEGYDTLPAHFARSGLSTACFGKLHTQNDEGVYTYGFQTALTVQSGDPFLEVYNRYNEGVPVSEADPADMAVFLANPYRPFTGRPLLDEREDDDYVLVQEAIAWLREHKDERFFLYVSLRAPHFPFDLPEAYYYLHDPATVTLPEVLPDDYQDSASARLYMEEHGWEGMTEEQTRLVMARYLGAVAWHDKLVGDLLAVLQELGLDQRTLVAWGSDHGDMAGEKGMWLKNLMFDDSARKALILRMPGVLPENATCDSLISEVDIWPTLAGLVGLQALPGIRGQDLSKVLLGEEPGPEYVYAVAGVHDWDEHPWMVMVRNERYKLVRYRPVEGVARSYELYDLELDPTEIVNVAKDEAFADILATLDGALDQMLHSIVEPQFPIEQVFDTSE